MKQVHINKHDLTKGDNAPSDIRFPNNPNNPTQMFWGQQIKLYITFESPRHAISAGPITFICALVCGPMFLANVKQIPIVVFT